MKKMNNNSISIAGEFAVLSQLALRGYDANMTLGHTKSVDILASNPSTGKMFKIEVKTNFNNNQNKVSVSKLFGTSISEWMMGKKHESIIDPDLFYCFVNIGKDTNHFRFFLVPSLVVANYVKKEHKLWLNAGQNRKSDEMRKFRIGIKGEKYRIPTPISDMYENNWDFKK